LERGNADVVTGCACLVFGVAEGGDLGLAEGDTGIIE
jgi:hypothetical protein